MSLTSYRAAPPRDNRYDAGASARRGLCSKGAWRGTSPKLGPSARNVTNLSSGHRKAGLPRFRPVDCDIGASYKLHMVAEKPAVRPDIAVGEALRAVARDILAEAHA